MIIRLLTVVAVAVGSVGLLAAESGSSSETKDASRPSKAKAAKTKRKTGLTKEEAELIDRLVKEVVSQTQPARKARPATTRPAKTQPKVRKRIRVVRPTATQPAAQPKAPTAKPARPDRDKVASKDKPATKPNQDKPSKAAKTPKPKAKPRAAVAKQPTTAEKPQAERRTVTVKKAAAKKDESTDRPAKAKKAQPAREVAKDRPARKKKDQAPQASPRPRRAAEGDEDAARLRLDLDRPSPVAGRSRRMAKPSPSTQEAISVLENLPELSNLGSRVQIVPTGPDTVVIEGDEEAVAALEEMIRMMDLSEVPQELEIFQLRNAQALTLAPMLSSLLQQAFRTPGRRPRPSDQVTVLSDPRSNSLLVAAAPERMGEIRDIIDKLDAQPLIGPVTFKTFPLQHMRATEASELLEQMIDRLQQQRGVRGETITIIPDDRTNTLIVTAPEADIKQVGQMIDLIDVKPDFATAKMVHIPLLNADAQTLSTMLTEMLNQRLGGRRGQALAEQIRRLQIRTKSGEQLPELDLEKPIKITADTGTNSVLVGSTEQNLEAMTEIIKLFDAVPVAEGVEVRIFPLKDADATSLAQMVQQVFQEGKQLSAGPGGRSRGRTAAVPKSVVGEAMMYNVGVAADERTNTLIVSGRPEQIIFVQEMVSYLDKPGILSRWPIRMHQVEHADAASLAQTINQLMSERLQAIQRLGRANVERERVVVLADVLSNSLIIMAREENFEEIIDLAKKLDTSKSVAGDVRMISLEKTQANVIQPKIEQLWQRRMQLIQRGGGVRDMPVIVVDERSNSLIVASSKADFEAIKELVKTLEEAPLTPIADIRIIRLEHQIARELGPTLQRLFQERMQMRQVPGQRALPSDQVAIFPDPESNALLVASSKENFETLEELVKKLDVEMALEGVVKFFKLEYADATRIAETVEGMFQEGLYKPAGIGRDTSLARERDKVVIEPDMRTNSLIVSASKENYSIIEQLIKKMDVKDAPFLEGNIQLYKVKHSDSVKLAGMLEEVLQKMQTFRQRVGPELPVTVIPDPVTNTLVISGSRDVLSQAESLLKELDQPQEEPLRDIKPYSLVHASASKVAQILQDLFSERRQGQGVSRGSTPFVRADETANVLIVSASPEDHKVVESLLKHVDVRSEASQRMQIFPLKQARAEELRDIVEELYSQQQTDRGRGAGPGISLAVDPQTNSLVVWAAPSAMEDISELIQNLDVTNPKDETAVRIFRLQQADAEELADVLEDILTGRGRQGRAGDDSPIITYQHKDAETGEETVRKLVRRNVQIVPETLTNSLLVRAEPDSLDMLEQLIRSIDEIPPREVDVRVFSLVNADATEMVKVLEKLFKVGDQARRRGGRGADEEETLLTMGAAGMAAGLGGEAGPPGRQLLSFTPDTRTNAVIAAGTDEYLKLAEKLIRQLDEQEIEERTNITYQVKFTEAKELEQAIKTHFDNVSSIYQEFGDEEALQRQIEREVSVVADEKTETLLVSASPRFESKVMKMIHELDRPPPQVMIQVLLAEVTLDDRVELGLEFAVQDLLFSETAYVGANNTIKTPGANFDVVAGTDLGAAGATLGGFSFTITGEDFNFLLRALQTEGRLEVLSRPSIIAEDNEKAQISVGQEVPFVRGVDVSSAGRTQTQIEYEQVGIILDVTPHINPDGYVSLEVAPEISAITDSSVQVTEGVFAPIFSKREAETRVTVKDGETVVIGGLITSQEERRESKVPILGDVPGLGYLFRTTVSSKEKTELLIVLTPVVVKNEREYRDLSVRQRDETGLMDEVRTNPLMKGLQISPDEEELAPHEDLEIQPQGAIAPQGRIRKAEPGATRPNVQYGPAKPTYGPERPALIKNETPPADKPMIGADSFEDYLGQRR